MLTARWPGRAAAGLARDGIAAAAGWACLAVMAAAQLASSRTGHLVLFTGLIVVLLAASAVAFTAARCGAARALAAAAAGFALGLAAEWAGTRTGLPFGSYRYTGLLQPALGGVPLAVPLAWAGMGLPACAVGCLAARRAGWQIVTGAVALTAWDVFLDPQMIRSGFWRWAQPGPYQGVPLSNFAGWLAVSALLMAVFRLVLRGGLADRRLLAVYTVMAVMETVGFAVVFPHGRPVALAGGLAMGIPAAAAWAASRAGGRNGDASRAGARGDGRG